MVENQKQCDLNMYPQIKLISETVNSSQPYFGISVFPQQETPFLTDTDTPISSTLLSLVHFTPKIAVSTVHSLHLTTSPSSSFPPSFPARVTEIPILSELVSPYSVLPPIICSLLLKHELSFQNTISAHQSCT